MNVLAFIVTYMAFAGVFFFFMFRDFFKKLEEDKLAGKLQGEHDEKDACFAGFLLVICMSAFWPFFVAVMIVAKLLGKNK